MCVVLLGIPMVVVDGEYAAALAPRRVSLCMPPSVQSTTTMAEKRVGETKEDSGLSYDQLP